MVVGKAEKSHLWVPQDWLHRGPRAHGILIGDLPAHTPTSTAEEINPIADKYRANLKLSECGRWVASVVFGQRDMKLSRSRLVGSVAERPREVDSPVVRDRKPYFLVAVKLGKTRNEPFSIARLLSGADEVSLRSPGGHDFGLDPRQWVVFAGIVKWSRPIYDIRDNSPNERTGSEQESVEPHANWGLAP